MSVTADARYALESEIEGLRFKPGLVEEGDEEGSETAVYVKGYFALDGEFGKGRYVVHYAMGEVGRRADQEDGVAVD
jgi:hypothetical protein